MTVVGVLGGGQLGRMLAQAGDKLDLEIRCYDASPHACAGQIAPLTVGAFDDVVAIRAFAEACDAVTYEFENVPVGSVKALEEAGVVVRPSSRSLEAAQDRLLERRLFDTLDVPTPVWYPVDDLASLTGSMDKARAFVLKSRFGGYDGKGQAIVRDAAHAEAAWAEIGQRPAIADALVPFRAEVSCIGVRDADGRHATWAIGSNQHSDGILRESIVPTSLPGDQAEAAGAAWGRVADRLDHVGVLAIEFFVLDDGAILANEFAPRVHNTGHWTIEGASTSQFENHLRAVAGLPLGDTGFAPGVGAAAMVNLIGGVPPVVRGGGGSGGSEAAVHDYGKSPRPGRKVGHATVVGPTMEAVHRVLGPARELATRATEAGLAQEVGG
ncbi:MAG: 5-(carboxyamino)imidazole ribonucleotide synthase [Planctomycetota bacterium]